MKILYSYIICLIFFTSCSVQVTSSLDRESVTAYKTYSWAEEPQVKPEYSRESKKKVLQLNIKQEVENELEKRGFILDNAHPDFIISYRAVVEKPDNSSNLDWTRPGFSPAFSGYVSNNTSSTNPAAMAENLLSVKIEMLDPSSQKPLWTGSKETYIGEVMTLTGIVGRDVKNIFRKFPLKNKSNK